MSARQRERENANSKVSRHAAYVVQSRVAARSVLYVFAALHQGVLGALLTLGQVMWYPLAAARARGQGLRAFLPRA